MNKIFSIVVVLLTFVCLVLFSPIVAVELGILAAIWFVFTFSYMMLSLLEDVSLKTHIRYILMSPLLFPSLIIAICMFVIIILLGEDD